MSLEALAPEMLRLKNALEAFYFKTGNVLEIESLFGVKPRQYKSYLSQLVGHVNLEKGSYRFERCVNEILGISLDVNSKNQIYSEEEIKLGLLNYVTGEWGPSVVRKEVGVPERTINLKRQWLMKLLGFVGNSRDFKAYCLSHFEFVKHTIDHHVIKCSTHEPMLDESEACVVGILCHALGETGFGGKNRKGYKDKIKEVVHAKGDCIVQAAELSNDNAMLKLGKRMQRAKITAKTARSYSGIRLKPITEPGVAVPTFRKSHAVSFKRAAAGAPKLDFLMHKKFELQFQQDYEGGLSPTPTPAAWQMINGDEIGLAPEGDYTAAFTLDSKHSQWRIVHGERSIYWVSMLYASGAHGWTSSPMIVHQGGTDTKMPAKFTNDLPDNFGVHCTPSGYMDKEGFRAFAEILVSELQPKAGHMLYFFVDGHESHFDLDALQYLLAHHIRVMFLKANDSINDQPQDNGMNAAFKSCYSEAVEEWRQQWATVPFTVEFMNGVIAKAWNAYLAKPDLTRIIARAFEKTGIFPFSCIADRDPEKALVSAKLCETFCRDDRDRSELKRMKDEYAGRTGVSLDTAAPSATAVPVQTVSFADVNMKTLITGTAYGDTLVTPSGSPQQFRVVVSKGVADVVQKQYIQPAQALADELAKHDKLRNIQLDKPAAKSCRMPNTTTGACTNGKLLEQLREAQKNKADKLAEELARKKANDLKRGKLLVELETERDIFLSLVAEHGETAWVNNKAYSRDRLNKVYKSLDGLMSPSKFNKAEIIEAIRILLAEWLTAHQYYASDDDGEMAVAMVPESGDSDSERD